MITSATEEIKMRACMSIWNRTFPGRRQGMAHVTQTRWHGPLTTYVKLRVAHAPGKPGTFSRHRLQRKPLFSDHGTCVTHVPWCISGSLTRSGGETFPAFPAHAQPAIMPIWQEAHASRIWITSSCLSLRTVNIIWSLLHVDVALLYGKS